MDAIEPISHVGELYSPMFVNATSLGTPDPAWRGFRAARVESATFIEAALSLAMGKGLSDLATATGPSEVITLPAALDATEYDGDGLMTLEIVAELGNERAFLRTASEIDWSRRPATDFARAVRLALATGAHLFARNLAAQGAERYPDHAELKKMAYILAPPRVVGTGLPPDPSVRANLEWMRTHAVKYRGQWVALKQGVLLASAPTARELREQLSTTDGLFLTRVV